MKIIDNIQAHVITKRIGMIINVLPVNDLRKHEEITTCWCLPRVDFYNEGILIVHNSADGRELIEPIRETL